MNLKSILKLEFKNKFNLAIEGFLFFFLKIIAVSLFIVILSQSSLSSFRLFPSDFFIESAEAREAKDGDYKSPEYKEYADVMNEEDSKSKNSKESGFLLGINGSMNLPTIYYVSNHFSSTSVEDIKSKFNINLLVGYYFKGPWYFAIQVPFIIKSRENQHSHRKLQEMHIDIEMHLGPTFFNILSLNAILGGAIGVMNIIGQKKSPTMFGFIMGGEARVHIFFVDLALGVKQYFFNLSTSGYAKSSEMNYIGTFEVFLEFDFCF